METCRETFGFCSKLWEVVIWLRSPYVFVEDVGKCDQKLRVFVEDVQKTFRRRCVFVEDVNFNKKN